MYVSFSIVLFDFADRDVFSYSFCRVIDVYTISIFNVLINVVQIVRHTQRYKFSTDIIK